MDGDERTRLLAGEVIHEAAPGEEDGDSEDEQGSKGHTVVDLTGRQGPDTIRSS